jgi:maleate isomerase
MPATTPRIGLIVPSSNTVMEPDFHRHFRSAAIVSTTRILLEQVTRDAEFQMLEELPRALELIRTTAPDTVVFGCTSAGSLEGLAHDGRIARTIEQQTGARAVTVLEAVVAQLNAIRPKRVAVCTPYLEALTKSVVECVVEAGYSVVETAGMGLRENLDIGRVTPSEIVAFVESSVAAAAADCLFLSCTNWRAVEAAESLRSKLGIPVVTSNQAAIDMVQQPLAARV